MNKFNVGDMLTNKKREKHHDNLELYYLVVVEWFNSREGGNFMPFKYYP